MNIANHLEIERLRLLLESASKEVSDAAHKLNDEQVDSAVSRKEYFEKLAIGAGAAIAAIVSFIGTHSGRLQPAWLLRCSLVSLVIALIAALYRNFRYPNYKLEVRKRIWMEALLKEQQCKKDFFSVNRGMIDIHTGQPISGQWAQECEESDSRTKDAIDASSKRENRLLQEWHWAEYACVITIGIAMIALVWLAIRNF
ncbi:MAG: hypothetical protein ACYCPO_11135 [Acidobacteriaceae bacterium]